MDGITAVERLILDKIDTLHQKVEGVEVKVDLHNEHLHNFKLETLRNHAACKEDCHAKINKLNLTIVKVIGIAGAGGVAGQGLDFLLKTYLGG